MKFTILLADVKIGEQFGFGEITSLGGLTGSLAMPMFSIASILVIVYLLWGAFRYLISQGDKEEVAAARQMITQAIVGFIILIFAFFILQFLLSGLFGTTGLNIIGT